MNGTAPQIAETWITAFSRALDAADRERLAALFLAESYWRDLLALTGDFGSRAGGQQIAGALIAALPARSPGGWRVSPRLTAPREVTRVAREVVEAFLEFETSAGPCSGVVRLVVDDTGTARAWVLLTRRDDVRDGPRLLGTGNPRPAPPGGEERDPDVLVVGAGHSGLFIATHLARLGIDALIVDTHERIGDNWRERYESLALHNPTGMVQFPYLPFPESFPPYLPKDLLADWFEFYAQAMRLDWWPGTRFTGGSYDEAAGRWTARVVRDGRERVVRPRHIVLATGGVGGSPNIPRLPGIDDFTGPVLHTRDYASGAGYRGRRVLVVGVGSSGHDVAADLSRHGAHATMLQRSPTSVVSIEGANLSYPHYLDGTPLAEADLLSSAGFILPLMIPAYQALTRRTDELDREMLDGLRAAGLRLDGGDHGTGWLLKFFQRSGGYYFDSGTAAMIIDGRIAVLQADDVERFEAAGLVLRDGSRVPVDDVILATGYVNQQAELRQYFGDAVADAVGPVSGFGEDGELRNAWRRTAQPGLWIMVSGFSAARIHSPLLAMQIHDDLSG